MKVSGVLSAFTGSTVGGGHGKVRGSRGSNLGTSAATAMVAAMMLLSISCVSAGTVGTSGPNRATDKEIKILTPPDDAKTVAIAVVTGAENRFADLSTPELWKVVTMPIGEFVVFSETPDLKHLSKNIYGAVIPGGISCATFSNSDCSNQRRDGVGAHCEFNIDGPNSVMRWGINSKPDCMLCLRNSDVLRDGKYQRFDLELCDVHEDMAQERLRRLRGDKKSEGGSGSGSGSETTPLSTQQPQGKRVRRQW
ncbi:hypothetical protein DFH27DRAFT_51402 [Peziza echinospora]|nr:hypothetical protein DFH27DRAFT_51402 [Peziza echinospora]